MKNRWIKPVGKTLLGILLVYYVIRSNMVDFESLGAILWDPSCLVISFLIIGLCTLSCATRWYLLTQAQGLSLSYWVTLQLAMIGVFFNTFMPGAVGGDLIKAWYVAGEEPTKKTKAILTILLDRLLGLTVLIGYASFTLLFFSRWIESIPQLQLLGFSLWILTAAILLGGLVFFHPQLWQSQAVQFLLSQLSRLAWLTSILDAILLYRKKLPTILGGIAFSFLNVLGVTLLFYFLGRHLGIELELSKYFFVVPLGLVASGIPLLPGGIGVGQVAFFTLFQWSGLANPEQGGTLCTLYQIYFVLFNCTGSLIYLRFKRKNRSVALPESLPAPENGFSA